MTDKMLPAAAPPAEAPAERGDWVMVPRQMTDAMVSAFFESSHPRDCWEEILAAAPAAPAEGDWELIGYEYQHEETGLTTFVNAQQVEWGFEKNNPRHYRVGPCYRPRKDTAPRVTGGREEMACHWPNCACSLPCKPIQAATGGEVGS